MCTSFVATPKALAVDFAGFLALPITWVGAGGAEGI
jgi:hypothetical protein